MTQLRTGVLSVPQPAVMELQGNYQVAVVDAENKVSIRPVKVGDLFGNMWIIVEGLKPGERVIVEGTQKAQEGSVVAPKPYVAPVLPQTGMNKPDGASQPPRI